MKKYLLLLKYTDDGITWTIWEQADTLEEINSKAAEARAFYKNIFLVVENKEEK